MPKLPPKICREAGCFAKAMPPSTYCERHKAKHGQWTDKGSNWSKESRQDRGYGREWERRRKWVLDRDLHLCQVCLNAGRYTPASQVDHIVPKSRGGTDDLLNLQAICSECHKAKTAGERQ